MLITNFASGELSQNLNGRVDIQPYYQGAATIKNFDIIPTGGIKRRVGTQRIAELYGEARIIPFIMNKDSVYILELSLNASYDPEDPDSKPSLMKVWKKNIAGNYVVIQTLGLPYGNMDAIRSIQYAQNYNVIIFTHRDYKPYWLEMTAEVFSGSEMVFDFYPDIELDLDDDYDYIMIPALGTNLPTKETTADGHGRFTYYRDIGGVTSLYTKDFPQNIKDFYAIKDGKLYQWDHDNNNWMVYGADPQIDTNLFNDVNKYPSCVAFFNNRLFFASSGEHPQMVWASAAPDSYGNRYNDFCTYKKYVTVNRVIMDADMHIFTCDLAKADIDTVNHRTTFKNVTQDFTIDGSLKTAITDYFVTSAILPVGTKVVSCTQNTITVDTDKIAVVWDETGEDPETEKTNFVMSIQLWRSAEAVTAENYEFMVVANNITTADCALFFEIASDQNDAIKFLSSNRFLAIGTESSIWSVAPGITALSINAVMQGRYGSDSIQGQAVETATVYFAQGNKGIREFYYDGQSEAFRTNNIALLADHILRESAVVDFDYMTNPYSRLVIIREDGTAAVMLYDKTNGIMAWNRLVHGKARIINCAITRGEDENDLVFFVVQEGSGNEARYFLELLDLGSSFYIDSWKLYDATAQTPADGYTAGAILWNKTRDMTCFYDNIPEGFIEPGNEIYIGYAFESYIKSMPVVAGELSKRQRIASLYVRFLNSFLPVVKVTDLPDEKFTTITQLPYSGVGKVNYPGSTDRDVCFELKTDGVRPVNILSVEAQLA